MDDGTIVGRRSDLQKVFDLLSNEGPNLGLQLNPAKSSVWCGSHLPSGLVDTDPLARGVPPSAAAGYHLLGAPIGNIPFSRDVVEKRIEFSTNSRLLMTRKPNLLFSAHASHSQNSVTVFGPATPPISFQRTNILTLSKSPLSPNNLVVHCATTQRSMPFYL